MLSFVWRFLERNSLGTFFVFLQLVSVVLIFSRNSMQRSFVAAHASAFNAFVSGYIDEGASYFRRSHRKSFHYRIFYSRY